MYGHQNFNPYLVNGEQFDMEKQAKSVHHNYKNQNGHPNKVNIENPQFNDQIGQNLVNFSDQNIRVGFVRKVLSIIAFQFLITTLFIVAAVFSNEYKKWIFQNNWVLLLSVFITLTCLIAIYCYRNVCRKTPQNYIILLTYTIFESILISFLCGIIKPEIVLMASGLTFIIVFCLGSYAMFSKNDITQKVAFFIYVPLVLITLIIIYSFFRSYFLQALISLLIIGFFSMYLVFDLQRLFNNQNNKIFYEYDDYIIAALDIYIDIIMIFQELMAVLSISNR